jgi:hypothetical protein
MPAPVQMQQGPLGQLQQKATNMAVDGAVGGVVDYMKQAPIEKTLQAAGGAFDAASVAAMDGATSAATSGIPSLAGVGNPAMAAIGGALKGEYDQAAGAALGAVAGSTFGPVGTFIGSKLGGVAGDSVGSIFGFQNGTPNVGGKGMSPAMGQMNIGPKPIPSGSFISKGSSAPTQYFSELSPFDPAAIGRSRIASTPGVRGSGGKGSGTAPVVPVAPAAPAQPTYNGTPIYQPPSLPIPGTMLQRSPDQMPSWQGGAIGWVDPMATNLGGQG